MPSFEGRFGSIRHGPFALTGAPIHEPIVSRMQRAAETPFRRDAAVTYDAAIESFILPAPTAAPAPTGAGQFATEQEARSPSLGHRRLGEHKIGHLPLRRNPQLRQHEVWDLYV